MSYVKQHSLFLIRFYENETSTDNKQCVMTFEGKPPMKSKLLLFTSNLFTVLSLLFAIL